MATERMSYTSPAPTTEFLMYADRVGQSVSGNYTTVRIYIRAYNRGSSSSYSSYSGYHHGWIEGYGDEDIAKSQTPFLPSGVATDGQRWSLTRDINVKHGSNGTRGAVTLHMTVHGWNGAVDIEKTYSFNDFPDIDLASAPNAGTAKTPSNVSRSAMTFDIDNNGDNGADITSAEVRWSTNSDINAAGYKSAQYMTANFIYTINGLNRYTTYYLWGRLYNSKGWSPWSNRVQATTSYDNPEAPTPLGIDNVTQSGVHFWFRGNDDGGPGWAEWQVGYGTDINGPQYYMNPGGGDAWIGGLARNSHYYIWVRGRTNANVWTLWSSRSEFQTLAYNPSPPKPQYIDNVSQTQFHYVFAYPDDDGGAGIVEWQVAYGSDPNSAQVYYNPGGGDTWITGLAPGNTYYVWVRGRNQQGWSDWGMYFPNGQRTTARTAAGARRKMAGVWREVIPMVKTGGVWKIAQPYVLQPPGVWKRSV